MKKIFLFMVVFLVGGVLVVPSAFAQTGRNASCDQVDINVDGRINIVDLVKVARLFGRRTVPSNLVPEDVNQDRTVNIIDLAMVAKYFGRSCSGVFTSALTYTFPDSLLPISWSLSGVTVDSPIRGYALRLCPEGAVAERGGCNQSSVTGKTYFQREGSAAQSTSENFRIPASLTPGNYYVSLRVTPSKGASTQEFKSEVFEVKAVPDVFTVTGKVWDVTGTLLPDFYSVRVNSGESKPLGEAGPGAYSIVLSNLSSDNTPPVRLGDSLFVEVLDADGRVVAETRHTVDPSSLAEATVNLNINLKMVLPDVFSVDGTVRDAGGTPLPSPYSARVNSGEKQSLGEGGPGVYSIVLANLSSGGAPPVQLGDSLLVEIFDGGGSVVASRKYVVTATDLANANAHLDITLTTTLPSATFTSPTAATSLLPGSSLSVSWSLSGMTIDSTGEYSLRLCPEGAVVDSKAGCKQFEVSGTYSVRRGNEAKRTSETFTLPSTIAAGRYYVSLRVTPRSGVSPQEFTSPLFLVRAVEKPVSLPTCPPNKRGSVCVVSLAFRDSITEVAVGQSVGLSAQVLNETNESVAFTSAFLIASRGGIYSGLEGGVMQSRPLPQGVVLAPESGRYKYDFDVTFMEPGTYHFITAFLKKDGVVTDAPNGVMNIKVVSPSAWGGASERVVFVPIQEEPARAQGFASVLKSIFWVLGE